MSKNFQGRLSRRRFLRRSAMGAWVAVSWTPRHVLGGAGHVPPSETINVAGIGASGRGYYDLIDASRAGANIVALCDVDSERAAQTFQQFERARRYEDYRRMLEQEDKHIDAVVPEEPIFLFNPRHPDADSIRIGEPQPFSFDPRLV